MTRAGERLVAAAGEVLAMVRLEDDALVGSRWTDRLGTVKIMGVVDGWIVARRPKCAPFLVHKNDWLQRYSKLPA